ncbi:hypothetical protein A5686_09690 [Mycobacterium sp. E2479]|nr:hypothetical protein A5686_09690 [Mycobacterium sp. E2479]
MEVTTLGISVPRTARVRIGSTESVGGTGVIARTARAAGAISGSTGAAGVLRGTAGTTWLFRGTARTTWATGVLRGTAGSTWAAMRSTRTTRTTGPAGTAGIIGTGRSRPAMVTARTTRRRGAVTTRRLWCTGSSVGEPGAHSQGRSAERSGDGHPSDKLLQLHNSSPIH